MIARSFLFLTFSFLLLLGAGLSSASLAADRPNIVWIVSEDNSKHYLKLFDKDGVETPHIARLAEEGLLFPHAFSNAPVCSVARTTLATGCYAPRIGTQYHRRSAMAPMPEGLQMFPAYLRAAGYYTTNNSKQDYNAIAGSDVWDESSSKATWRKRKKGQPFFHMQSHGDSHEGRLHFSREHFEKEKTVNDPAEVVLQDYFPDTPLFRYTRAFYHDRIQAIDKIVGQTVARLEEDGVLEDTFIFYFSDHGGVLPRGKGYIQESGLHIPLVVRIPEKWRDQVDAARGSTIPGFVSFIDFGPTALELAGVDVPEEMDGKAFLGPSVKTEEVNQRNSVFGYADRFDEKYDLCRSIRRGKWKYIRNYQPYLPDGLQNNYRYFMLAYQEWRELYKKGKLNEAQSQFFEPKSAERLYDLESDPHEVKNLAESPEHRETLLSLRSALQEQVRSLPDLSFFPESHLYEHAMENPVLFGQKNKELIATLVDTADLALLPVAEAEPKLREALKSEIPQVRYWAATACASLGQEASELVPDVRKLLRDENLPVRLRATEFLGLLGAVDPRTHLLRILNRTENPIEALEALNTAVFFQDHNEVAYPFDVEALQLKVEDGELYRRIGYLGGDPNPPRPGKKKKKKAK